jgi:hypothetical protein
MLYKRREDLKVQEISEELLLLDEQLGQVHHLNPTASFVWQRCDGHMSESEIVQQLVATFDVKADVATLDVSEILRQLCDMGLING